jgi:hypothetical protein
MITTTLSQLYLRFNPQYDRDVNQLELRASSEAGPLRVKTRQAFFTSTTSRAAHQANALTLARISLGNSIRERRPHADSEEVNQCLETIWGNVMGARSALHIRNVRDLRRAVIALPCKNPTAPAQPSSESGGDTGQPSECHWHTSRQALSRALPASSFASAAAPGIAAPVPTATTSPAPRPTATRQQASAQSTGVQDARARLARENDRIEALSRLKKVYSQAAVPRLQAADQAYFEDRLRNLVECADKYLPELMRGRTQDLAILEAAAGHIRGSEGLRLDSRAALYKALIGRDNGAAQRLLQALGPAEASALKKSLVIVHSPARTLADTARADAQSGQNNHLQK